MQKNIGAIGLDLGGNNAVIAVAKGATVEIITNEASHRETPVVVGFGPSERFIGEQGYAQLKSNFKNTIIYPNRFLGLTPDAPVLEEEKKYIFTPIVPTDDNKIAFEIQNRGEKQKFIPEQAVAMMLSKVKENITKAGFSANEMVISVPSYYTEQERKALLDAGKIAKINIIKLMSESTAIAAGYGLFRRGELSANPRNVVFVDFGHCSASVSLGALSKDKTTILSEIHERNLGTRDFDWKLFEFYADMCQKKFGVDIKANPKTRLRMLDAIEKQRKVLSANSEAVLSVDNVAEDEDLSYTLTREKFEEIITPVVKKFIQMLSELRSSIKVPIHSIEIVGGGTRIPIIQKAIQEVFKMECSRTLNGSESIARGCAMQAAMLSPAFKFVPYTIQEANYYPIRCSWTFRENDGMEIEAEPGYEKKRTAVLFPAGCSVPIAKVMTFHQDKNIELSLSYDIRTPTGGSPLLARYIIQGKKARTPDFSTKVRIAINHSGLLELDNAQLVEEFFEDNLAVGGHNQGFFNQFGSTFKKSPRSFKQQEDEVKRKKGSNSTDLQTQSSSFNSMTEQQIQYYASEEAQMLYQDRSVHETHEKRNELEAYLYDCRAKLNEKYSDYIRPEAKATMLEELDRLENWLYSEGAKTTIQIYQQKLDKLKRDMRPVETRYADFESIPEYLSQFSKTLENFENIGNLKDSKYRNISNEDRQAVLQGVGENRQWLSDVERRLTNTNKLDNPPVSSQDLTNKMQEFMTKFSPLLSK